MKRISIKAFAKDEEGATASEYALMAGLISAVIAFTVTSVGTAVYQLFTTAAGMFSGS